MKEVIVSIKLIFLKTIFVPLKKKFKIKKKELNWCLKFGGIEASFLKMWWPLKGLLGF